ncbi:hypothetical protein OG413_44815 [Streptomyces sp. NBC_01433]|uniref:hypothetical protein n=1 Tax=Streptomyces sp. NBC_01433 TaxID=2903864 RepID=UPI00225A870D|nr:hypothetical protein [Streptomyces sp. NBC_01433]MCX4682308.1 hypothetical protein [Streptomyces sp. NBC_01433]
MTTNDVIDRVIDFGQELPAYGEAAYEWISGNVWLLFLVPAVFIAFALVISVARRRFGLGPLKGRQAFEVLPTTGFDPVLEDVLRFAKHLAQAQRSVSRWAFTPVRGTAVRVRLLSQNGLLTMRVEGPARAAEVLRHQGYRQCEMRAVGAAMADAERPEIRLGVGLDTDTQTALAA